MNAREKGRKEQTKGGKEEGRKKKKKGRKEQNRKVNLDCAICKCLCFSLLRESIHVFVHVCVCICAFVYISVCLCDVNCLFNNSRF